MALETEATFGEQTKQALFGRVCGIIPAIYQGNKHV
jgi:hypothetical protein